MEIVNPIVESYIQSLHSKTPLLTSLAGLKDLATSKNIPLLRDNTALFLQMLMMLHRPKRILEIGTGSGYSTLSILSTISPDASVLTLERDPNRYREAVERFADESRVRVEKIDALKFLADTTILEDAPESFDMVFLDAQKRDYIDFLPLIEKRLLPGGLFLADNVLFGGKAAYLAPEKEAKYAGGVALLREFNSTLAESDVFDTVFLPIDDGVAVAIKKSCV